MQKNYVTSAIVFGITAVISGVGILIYRLISKRRAEKIGRSAVDSDKGPLYETDAVTNAASDFDTVALTDTAVAAADTDISNTADKTDSTGAANENGTAGADANTDAAEDDEDRQISKSE